MCLSWGDVLAADLKCFHGPAAPGVSLSPCPMAAHAGQGGSEQPCLKRCVGDMHVWLDLCLAVECSEGLGKPLVFPAQPSSHGRGCGSDQQQRWVSQRLSLGCGTVPGWSPGDMHPHWHQGCTQRQEWVSGTWSSADFGLPHSLVSEGLRGREWLPQESDPDLCSGSRWRCHSCAPLLGTAVWNCAASGLVPHLCLEGLQLDFSGQLLPFSLISELEHFTGEKTRAEGGERLPKLLC